MPMPDLRASDIIPGVTHVTLRQFPDDRGFFMETWRANWLPASDFVHSFMMAALPAAESRRGSPLGSV